MSLINTLQENFFAIGRYWGNLNSSIVRTQSIWAMSTGIPAADLNWAWNEKALAAKDTEEAIRIKEHYEKLELPFWWWVYPSVQTLGLKEIFLNSGFRFLTSIPCLIADLDLLSSESSGSLIQFAPEISLVENKEDLELWAELSFAGFEMALATKKQFYGFVMLFDISLQSPQKLFVACVNGQPVASSLLFFHEDIAGIYFVSTLPVYRRKSIGLALTYATMHYAKKAGAKYSILQSSESGLNVYKRAGFQECCQADIYIPH